MSLHRSERHCALDTQFAPDTQPSVHWAACNDGPCQQGRRLCPTPMACQRPQDEDVVGARIGFALFVLSAAIVVAVGYLLVDYFRQVVS